MYAAIRDTMLEGILAMTHLARLAYWLLRSVVLLLLLLLLGSYASCTAIQALQYYPHSGLFTLQSWISWRSWPATCSALTLLVGWQKGHPACKNVLQLVPKNFFEGTNSRKGGQLNKQEAQLSLRDCATRCQLKSGKILHKCSTDCTWKGLQQGNDLQGHSRSLTLVPFDRQHTISN